MNLIDSFERRRDALSAGGRLPPWILVLDIDSTLMDTGPRNRAILEAALRDIPALAPAAAALRAASSSWNVVDPARACGLLDEGAVSAFEAYWRERFFSDEWLLRDAPYPGVPDFLRALVSRGFGLVYLTGRHAGGMERGTRESFALHGLPVGERFLFKPRFEDDDTAFKLDACAALARFGTVVGSIDNEPANVNLFARFFPEALNVWMRTITSPAAVPLKPGIPEAGPECYLPGKSAPGV